MRANLQTHTHMYTHAYGDKIDVWLSCSSICACIRTWLDRSIDRVGERKAKIGSEAVCGLATSVRYVEGWMVYGYVHTTNKYTTHVYTVCILVYLPQASHVGRPCGAVPF
mmetsp:Transcript_49090/g.123038  ORF Transcript_49090/g.123038 Transcript_49090/m.123038 type:complete len:110 (-) Transcript_49090:1194-1523(-)